MMEIATSYDQREPVGPDAFPGPLDNDPISRTVIGLLERIANYSERQREKDAPDVIQLNAATPTYVTKTGLRVSSLAISCNPTTDNIRISVGLRQYNFFSAGWFLFPIDITNGIDLTVADITTPANANFNVFIFGYPY